MVQIDDDYYEDLTEKDMHEIIDELKVVYSEYFSDSFLLTWNTVSHFFLLLHNIRNSRKLFVREYSIF